MSYPSAPKRYLQRITMNEMSESLSRIQNYNGGKGVKRHGSFIRKLVRGSAHIGIHVAKMAGMPQIVILKAQSS
jgi:DNA mismatch repair protein MutS